jgi:hypothetical protein
MRLEHETADAINRFAACLCEASGESASHPAVAACSALAVRAFGGDHDAWAPLVAAVRRLLAVPAGNSAHGSKSRRELRAFVAENADLLEF